MAVQVVICDDDQKIHNDVEGIITGRTGRDANVVKVLHVYSAEELLDVDTDYDILFLDIEMPGMSGIDVKNVIEQQKKKVSIVFLTSHDERMPDAFGKNVIGFLTKPIERNKLEALFEKTIRQLEETLIEVEKNGKCDYIRATEIRYIEGQDKYTELYTENQVYLMRKSLAEWESILPAEMFCRVNKSYIIHYDIFDIRKGEIILDDEKVIKLSRKNKPQIVEGYKQYLRNKVRNV